MEKKLIGLLTIIMICGTMLAGCGVVREKQVNETNSTDNEFTTYRVVNDYIDTEIQVDSANQSSGYGIIYIKYHLL